MSKDKQPVPYAGSRLPATSVPRPSLPSLPTGNSMWPFDRGRYERDTRTVAASAGYLRARADQAAAMAELIGKRDDLALALARLHSLPERCAHEYEKGRAGRLHELSMLQLQHETDEVHAKVQLAAARQILAQYAPPPPTVAAPTPPAPVVVGLSPTEVENVVRASLPEVTPETLRSLVLLLRGALDEKKA